MNSKALNLSPPRNCGLSFISVLCVEEAPFLRNGQFICQFMLRDGRILLALLVASLWSSIAALDCPSGQIWNAASRTCTIDCTVIPHALPALNDISGCTCESPYKWNTDTCQIDCSKLNNTVSSDSSDSCQCTDNYVWNQTSQQCEQSQTLKDYYYYGDGYYYHDRYWVARVVIGSVVGGIIVITCLVLLIMCCACPQKFSRSSRRRRSPYGNYPPPPMRYPPMQYPPMQYPPVPPMQYPPMQNPYIPQAGMTPVNQAVPPPLPPVQVQQTAAAMTYPAMGSQLYSSTL